MDPVKSQGPQTAGKADGTSLAFGTKPCHSCGVASKQRSSLYPFHVFFFFFGTSHPSLLSAVLRVLCPADTPQTPHLLPTEDRTLIRY